MYAVQTWAPDGGQCSALLPGKVHVYPLYGRLDGVQSRSGLDVVQGNISFPCQDSVVDSSL
jgi:hypothetical protein